MKVVSLILLLIPVFIFQICIVQDVVLDYKSQEKAKKSKMQAIKNRNVQRNDLYYKIK